MTSPARKWVATAGMVLALMVGLGPAADATVGSPVTVITLPAETPDPPVSTETTGNTSVESTQTTVGSTNASSLPQPATVPTETVPATRPPGTVSADPRPLLVGLVILMLGTVGLLVARSRVATERTAAGSDPGPLERRLRELAAAASEDPGEDRPGDPAIEVDLSDDIDIETVYPWAGIERHDDATLTPPSWSRNHHRGH